MTKVLVSGWFSFEGMGASAGDLMACNVLRTWLEQAGIPYEVALAPPFAEKVMWVDLHAHDYESVIFVCGPFGNGQPVTEFLQKFGCCRLLGLNLSMLEPLEAWNPFEKLWERDSSRTSRPDLALLDAQARVPVVGVVLIDAQPEYGARDLHKAADAVVEQVLAEREVACLRIDTRLDDNKAGLRTAREIESLIARMDAVVTTRLHGLVLSLKNGVPVVALDPVAGGAKVRRQATALDWPLAFLTETARASEVGQALDRCLDGELTAAVARCRERAWKELQGIRGELVSALKANP